jgi:hypothetical protein
MENRSIVVRYQRRFSAHVDKVVDGDVGQRVGRAFGMSNVFAIGAECMA